MNMEQNPGLEEIRINFFTSWSLSQFLFFLIPGM